MMHAYQFTTATRVGRGSGCDAAFGASQGETAAGADLGGGTK